MQIRNLLLLAQLAGSALAVSPKYLRGVQTVLNGVRLGGSPNIVNEIANVVKTDRHGDKVRALMEDDDARVWEEDGERYVERAGTTYRVVSNPDVDGYQLRITTRRTKSTNICDNSAGVDGVSGYLDISSRKHLFFWFFKTRGGNAASAPLILFLGGGPGCSSSLGLAWGQGPCRIKQHGIDANYQHSWLTFSNMIFLDHVPGTGYSYGSEVDNSEDAGKDAANFMKLFMEAFTAVKDCPFHIAGASYAGTYIPYLAHEIHKHKSSNHINLKSLIIGNGVVDPLVQLPKIPDYACDGPHKFLDDAKCATMKTKVGTCRDEIQKCYDGGSNTVCAYAQDYCANHTLLVIYDTPRNPYDVRLTCNPEEDGPACYKQTNWLDEWMKKSETKREFGADPDREFSVCSSEVFSAFAKVGDGARNPSKLLPALLTAGIRVLSYVGNEDSICDYIGNEAWMLKLQNKYKSDFAAANVISWYHRGRTAAKVRAVGGTSSQFGSYAFAEVIGAGHMAAVDQPEAIHELVKKWVANRALHVAKKKMVPREDEEVYEEELEELYDVVYDEE